METLYEIWHQGNWAMVAGMMNWYIAMEVFQTLIVYMWETTFIVEHDITLADTLVHGMME